MEQVKNFIHVNLNGREEDMFWETQNVAIIAGTGTKEPVPPKILNKGFPNV